jgi:hypothetical protein
MAEQWGPINRQVGQQPRFINKQFGQQPQSINQQGQQAHQPHGVAVRQENAQLWPSAGDVCYHASSPPCGEG